jgi:hypothetical protein
MVFRSRPRHDIVDTGARFRAQHSAWLTLAMMSGRRYPRIPSKPADLGGYDRLMSRPSGRRHAARWWRLALSRIGL